MRRTIIVGIGLIGVLIYLSYSGVSFDNNTDHYLYLLLVVIGALLLQFWPLVLFFGIGILLVILIRRNIRRSVEKGLRDAARIFQEEQQRQQHRETTK